MTIAQDVLNKIIDIPEENMIVGNFSDGKSKCCIAGHLARLESSNPSDYDPENCNDFYRSKNSDGHPIRELSRNFILHKTGNLWDIVDVNNYEKVRPYTEETPKARVVHLLNDMIEAGL